MNFAEQTEQDQDALATAADEVQDSDGADGEANPRAKPQLSRGTLGVMGLLAACAGATYLMYLHNGPQSADAATANTTINDFLSGDSSNLTLMRQTLQDTRKVVQQFLSYPGKTQVSLADLKTNPFRVGPDKPLSQESADAVSKHRREEERVAILKAVEGLQLQSILHSGARRACMINNSLYQEGQQVDSFTIEQIDPTLVVVRNGTYRFGLKMQRQ